MALSRPPELVLLERMPAAQQLLFPDPRPLVERLGAEFFQRLPEHPGVYLMRDAADVVLYVGKARNLRKRLGSYRVANPDRMPRRLLRMLRAVRRIELRECTDEAAALAKESELLRALKPRFNRAGTWSPVPRHLAWRLEGSTLELKVCETPDPGWRPLGPMGGAARRLRPVLIRLFWRAVYPERGVVQMPEGWNRGLFPDVATICCGSLGGEAAGVLEKLMAGRVDEFCEWTAARGAAQSHPFEKAALEADLEFLRDCFPGRRPEAPVRLSSELSVSSAVIFPISFNRG